MDWLTLLIATTTASFILRAGANCMRVFQAFSSSPPQSSMNGATVEYMRFCDLDKYKYFLYKIKLTFMTMQEDFSFNYLKSASLYIPKSRKALMPLFTFSTSIL